MMSLKLIFLSTTLMISATHAAQIGIGTSQPDRPLEVRGSGAQALRIHTSSNFAGTAGIELVRGTELNSALDWHISNDQGVLKITSGDFNLYTGFDLQLRIDTDDEVGIGTNVTHARLHIDGGGEASLGSDGFLQLGLSADENLIMDQNEIQARNNGNPASLFVQNTGGSTHFNAYGGYVRMGFNDGRLGVGTSNPSHRTSIHNDGWHLYLNNDGNLGADNEWYIGASDHTWAAGDDQLVFSPTSSSADAVLRLRNVTENDGTIAPVSIHSQNGQTLLLDGNEIDCASGALYINHNSGQNTYINPSGGKVGIGTPSPGAMLTLESPLGHPTFAMQRNTYRWDLAVSEVFDNLTWTSSSGGLLAWVSSFSGQWNAVSDARRKHNVQSLESTLDRLLQLELTSYAFKHDETGRRYLGAMAQDVAVHFPEVVHNNGKHYGMSYGQLAVVALRALQEQQALIALLEHEITRLEAIRNRSFHSSNHQR